MSLFTSETDLKSLKYSQFGTIGNPIIKPSIGDSPSNSLSQGVRRRVQDTRRMGTLLTRKEGVKFLANQALLSQTENLRKVKLSSLSRDKLSREKLLSLGRDTLRNTLGVSASILGQTAGAGTGLRLVNGLERFLESYLGNGLQTQKAIDGQEIFDYRPSEYQNFEIDTEDTSKAESLVPTESITLAPRFSNTVRKRTSADGVKHWGIDKRDALERRFYSLTNTGQDRLNIIDLSDLQVDVERELLIESDQIIPFQIEVYNPEDITQKTVLLFRAFIESLGDSFDGQWLESRYIGRAESVYNYLGFNRNIIMSFKIAAFSSEELVPLYDRLNALVGTTAPSYSEDGFFKRGLFTKLTVGDYVRKVPGFFPNISVNWETNYPWEIEKKGAVLPHVLDVSFTFNPIHDFNPEYGKRFIGVDNE